MLMKPTPGRGTSGTPPFDEAFKFRTNANMAACVHTYTEAKLIAVKAMPYEETVPSKKFITCASTVYSRCKVAAVLA